MQRCMKKIHNTNNQLIITLKWKQEDNTDILVDLPGVLYGDNIYCKHCEHASKEINS